MDGIGYDGGGVSGGPREETLGRMNRPEVALLEADEADKRPLGDWTDGRNTKEEGDS